MHTVIVTRPDGEQFAEKIRKCGLEAIIAPTFSLAAISNPDREKFHQIEQMYYQWLIFTSRHGVKFFSQFFKGNLPTKLKIAAIGVKTAEEFELHFKRTVDCIGGGESSEMFLEELITQLSPGTSVLIVCGKSRRGIIERELVNFKIKAEVLELYQQAARPFSEQIIGQLKGLPEQNQLWSFFSPSAFRYALEAYPDLLTRKQSVKLFSIGKITTQAIQAAQFSLTAEAKEQSEDGMLQAILEWIKDEG